MLSGHPEGWEKLQSEFPGLPVRHLGFVSPEFVQTLYQGATALVFFSLYEGFGMPLLDAFAAGTPVICSNTTSLPEVGGEAVLSCDPLDRDAMSALMQRITQDDALRAELIERGKERLRLFTWERAARNLREACQRSSKRLNSTCPNPDERTSRHDRDTVFQPGRISQTDDRKRAAANLPAYRIHGNGRGLE